MNCKQSDQVAMLKVCAEFTKTGQWNGLFTYPNCGWDLVQSGLVNEDKTITIAGKALLYLFCNGEDPIPESSAVVSITLGLNKVRDTTEAVEKGM